MHAIHHCCASIRKKTVLPVAAAIAESIVVVVAVGAGVVSAVFLMAKQRDLLIKIDDKIVN